MLQTLLDSDRKLNEVELAAITSLIEDICHQRCR
jgi:hypothetical protein